MSNEYAPPPGYGEYAPPNAVKNGAGVAGLVLAIVALILCITVVGAPLGLVLAIIGLVFSIIGFRRIGKRRATNKGVAITGLVINVIALLAGAVVTAFLAAGLIYALNNGGSEAWNCFLDANGDQTAVQQCVDDLNARAGVQ